MTILGLEVSTTSIKAMLFDASHGAVRIESVPYAHLPDQYGCCDADYVFAQMLKMGKRCAEGYSVDCVVLSCTWHSLLLCDRDMHPRSPMFLWCCGMARDYCNERRKNVSASHERYARTGALVNPCYPFYKLGYLKQNGTDLSDMYIAGNGSYFNYRLTGEFAESLSMVSGTGLFHLYNRCYDIALLRELDIDLTQLPKVLMPGTVLRLTGEAAKNLGLRPGTPFVPAMPDGALDQIGAGAMQPGAMSFSVGTSGSFRFHSTEAKISPNLDTWCYLAPDGSWLSGIGTSGCCNCVDWARRLLFGENTPYSEIEKGLQGIGKNAPIFLPFIFGERGPGWDDGHIGSFQELSASHTRFSLYYSVLEGVLFNLMQCYERLVALNGPEEKICLSGGILNSPIWLPMCLDFFGKPMYEIREKHSSLLGGILLGLQLTNPEALASYEERKQENRILQPTGSPDLFYERYRRYMHYYQSLGLD